MAKLLPVDFKPPRLYDAGGNTRAQWYVEWKGFDCRANAVRRMKMAVPTTLNKASRYEWARAAINQINEIAVTNKGRFYTGSPLVVRSFTLRQLLEKSLEIKKLQISSRSFRDYQNITNMLLEHVGENSAVSVFTRERAVDFLNTMQRKRKWTNKTRNNTLHALCAIFMPLTKNGMLASNPFSGIDSLRETIGDANPPFTIEQRNALRDVYQARYPELFHIATFIYSLMLRPIEVMRLQRKHLDFRNRQVRLPAASSKTNLVRHPKISAVFFDFLKNHNYENLPGSYFLFGDDLRPAPTVTRSDDRRKRVMENMHLKACRIIKHIHFEQKQRMYSWKSTSMVDMLRAGAKMKYIQEQCGHSTLVTTEIYFKNKGAFDSDYVKELDEKQVSI